MLKGKKIILGVSGSIACCRVTELASEMKKQGCETTVIMTQNAARFVCPLSFEAISGGEVYTDLFAQGVGGKIKHITLSAWADCLIIAPATANIIAELAHGLCGDMLTSTALACECAKIIAPAMNTRMYNNPVTRENLEKLGKAGWLVVEPESGVLACGETGSGKLASPERLLEAIDFAVSREKDMRSLRVCVTAGATVEAIDPVRYITNRSTGKMGYALAAAAAARGAEVTLIAGPGALPDPAFMRVKHTVSAADMFSAVTEISDCQDIVIMAAAVADFTPESIADEKIKKSGSGLNLRLRRTADILETLGKGKKPGQLLCGFSMETEGLLENSAEKLRKKNLDLIAANSLRQEGAGFGTDTNVLTLITADSTLPLGLMSKRDAADAVLDELMRIRLSGTGKREVRQ